MPSSPSCATGWGCADEVELVGERTGDEVLRAYQRADIFALTPCVTDDGDRDGVPNVVVEAMACGLPVVTTDAGGIPEAVRHGVNGLVAAPRDVGTLVGHLGELIADPRAPARAGCSGTADGRGALRRAPRGPGAVARLRGGGRS